MSKWLDPSGSSRVRQEGSKFAHPAVSKCQEALIKKIFRVIARLDKDFDADTHFYFIKEVMFCEDGKLGLEDARAVLHSIIIIRVLIVCVIRVGGSCGHIVSHVGRATGVDRCCVWTRQGEEVHEMFCVDQGRPDESESCNTHILLGQLWTGLPQTTDVWSPAPQTGSLLSHARATEFPSPQLETATVPPGVHSPSQLPMCSTYDESPECRRLQPTTSESHPQGRFSINLSATGFQLAEETKWISKGNYAVADIHKSKDGSKVTGMCGGYLGKCTPSSSSGLLITVA
ncbi:hypothetical protein J4Q44_G00102640 [Coregonus suidteri]|uniref:GON domain-containing protein n=1 Tax=Coregonus suidteri TaxID=861788 RepID=A0AAN8R1A1_9TELE